MLDKLSRISFRLKGLRRSIERYERTPVPMAAEPMVPVTVEPPASPPATPPASPAPAPGSLDSESGVPDFLRRSRPDAAALAIAAENEAKRKAKSHGRIAKLKAQQSGETKKMPLEGKAALAKIMGG